MTEQEKIEVCLKSVNDNLMWDDFRILLDNYNPTPKEINEVCNYILECSEIGTTSFNEKYKDLL